MNNKKVWQTLDGRPHPPPNLSGLRMRAVMILLHLLLTFKIAEVLSLYPV